MIMQALGILFLSIMTLSIIVMGVILLPAIFSFRPFDVQRVFSRSRLLLIAAMTSMMIGLSFLERTLSPLTMAALLELIGVILIGNLFAVLVW